MTDRDRDRPPAESAEGEGKPDSEPKAAGKSRAQPSPEEEAEAARKAEAAAVARAEREAAEAAKPPWERDPVTPEWQQADGDSLVTALRAKHPDAIESARTFAGDLVLKVERSSIAEVCESLKSGLGYRLLVDICGAHYPKREGPTYEVIYNLYSFEENRRVRLKVEADETTEVPTVCGVWRGADWPEREVYDMFGLRFAGHPDMTRILLWEGFNGHPLRKDFPVEGIDTGAAIYPEYYDGEAGPVAGTGTGWKPEKAPAEEEGTSE
ncbi:MAG: NADH-quinone oxidoreductase subunit C [Thermoanaerobaculia bacterium]